MTNSKKIEKKERVIVYVDGFNLYFGMKQSGFLCYRWLDIQSLALSLLKETQELRGVSYFTSRVSNNPEKQKRQTTYLEALEATGIQMFYGHYQSDKTECKRCGAVWKSYNEKMTDVNIATQMIIDAYKDRFDAAMLISGDSDLVPPIRAIHANFNNKRVFVVFPPSRYNASIALEARGNLILGKKKLANNQLNECVVSKTGFILMKPTKWI